MTISKKKKESLLDGLKTDLAAKVAESTNTAAENKTGLLAELQPVKSTEKIRIPVYLPSETLKTALKQLALDEKTSVNKLVLEGLSLVLKERGKSINDYLD